MDTGDFHISRNTFHLILAQKPEGDISPRGIASPKFCADERATETQILETLMTISTSGIKLSTFVNFFLKEAKLEPTRR